MLREHNRIGFLDELALGSSASLRKGYAFGCGLLLTVAIGIGVTRFGRGTLTTAVGDLIRAQPGWLLAAVAGFGAALLASAAAWRVGLRACGGSTGPTEISARYAVGSLVNAIAPAHVGGAVRLGLLSRTLTGEDRLWRAGGVAGAVAAARTLALAGLLVPAAAIGNVPLWPAPIFAVGVGVLVIAGVRLSRRRQGRLANFLQILRGVARSPREGAALFGWVVCSCVARIGAAIAIAMALGVHRPVLVAVVLLAAMALSGLLPLTPGNFGAGAGAATLALHGTGVGLGASLALGVAFQAVETVAGVTLGLVGAAVLAAPGTRIRRWSFAAAGVSLVLVAGVLGVVTVDFL